MPSRTIRSLPTRHLCLFIFVCVFSLVSVQGAHAGAPAPGIYAVLCGDMYRGDTREAALRSCERALRKDRYLDKRACNCQKHADIIRLDAGTPPAYFIADSSYRGPTPEKATAACRAAERTYHKQNREMGSAVRREAWPCKLEVIYGPFQRKPNGRGYDDSRVFRFLSERGDWVDEEGWPPCLVAGTLITTPFGDRPIESFGPGDLVSSWLPQQGRPVLARVTRVKRRTVASVLELRLADGRSVRATDNHPFWSPTKQEWIPAGQLRAGDVLGALAGPEVQDVTIRAIVTVPPAEPATDFTVYDLTVEPTHAYFANGVFTHNY